MNEIFKIFSGYTAILKWNTCILLYSIQKWKKLKEKV